MARRFWFFAKDANLYARLGSIARCGADAHGCPACPRPTIGPLILVYFVSPPSVLTNSPYWS